MMGAAEREAGDAHQPVGQIGRRRKALPGGVAQALAARLHIAHHAGRRREAELERIDSLENRDFVLLHILAVGERQAFHHRQQCDESPVQPARLGAHQFGRIGVALLRHDRAAGGERIAEPDETEFAAAPRHDLLGEAGQMHHSDRRRGEKLDRKVPVGHRVERICRGPVEAERGGARETVDRKGGSGERRGAERALVEPTPAIGEPAAIPPEHLDIGQ